MKCPHCDYFHGWNYDKKEEIKGESGEFYFLDTMLKRYAFWDTGEKAKLYACPACRKTFIEEL